MLESNRNLPLVFTKSSSTSVYESGAVQNGLLCEVDITALSFNKGVARDALA